MPRKLITACCEDIPSESFETLGPELNKIIKGKSGIYVLYRGKELYYIGLANDLNGRILHHLDQDHHAGKWNRFSVFIVKKVKYLRELEALALHILKPEGNKQTGKIPLSRELRATLRKAAKDYKDKSDALWDAFESSDPKLAKEKRESGWASMKRRYPNSSRVEQELKKVRRKKGSEGYIQKLDDLKAYWVRRGK